MRKYALLIDGTEYCNCDTLEINGDTLEEHLKAERDATIEQACELVRGLGEHASSDDVITALRSLSRSVNDVTTKSYVVGFNDGFAACKNDNPVAENGDITERTF